MSVLIAHWRLATSNNSREFPSTNRRANRKYLLMQKIIIKARSRMQRSAVCLNASLTKRAVPKGLPCMAKAPVRMTRSERNSRRLHFEAGLVRVYKQFQD